MQNQKMILYVDNEPCSFIGNSAEIVQMEQVAVKHHLYRLIDLVNLKCILPDDWLQKEIKEAVKSEDFSPFRTTLHNMESFLDESEDWEFLYLRTCEIDLGSFMENAIEKYQEKLKKSSEKHRSIRSIIEDFFNPPSYNIVCASLSNDDSPTNIVEILYYEVVEYYSLNSWDHAEMEINDISRYYREQITFSELVEYLHACCIDFG
jgi:hypothetical protein